MISIKKEEFNNEITLFIPEMLTSDKSFSNYSLAAFCVLQALSTPTQLPMQCVTYHQLIYYLTGEKAQQRNRITDYIKCGINELIENCIIMKCDEFQKHLILDCTNLWIDTDKEHFTVITFGDVQKIFKVENVNNFLLLRYYIILIGTISSKITVYLENGEYKNRVVGNFTIDYLSELSGISDRTIIEYNKILENIGLLYVFRPDDFTINKENYDIRRLANIYGKPCNSEYVIKYANSQEKHYETYHYKESNSKVANNKRRLAQMYQQLLKGRGENYSKEEILDVYKYVISENEKYERMYEKDKYEDYLDKIRDTDVFEKYDFIPNQTEK